MAVSASFILYFLNFEKDETSKNGLIIVNWVKGEVHEI